MYLSFIKEDAHISGSTFGEKGEVYGEKEEQQAGGKVGQHCACEARCKAKGAD